MEVEISMLEKEAFEANENEFLSLIEEAKEILEEESDLRDGSGLIRIAPPPVTRNVVVTGDIHGDMESLMHILRDIKDKGVSADKLVFLGDYGDRGVESVEIYYVLLKLKILAGERIIMLRGNHEGPPDLPVMPHDLPFLFARKYGEKGKEIYGEIKDLWERLPYSVLVDGKYLLLHGGLPVNVTSIEDIAFAHKFHPSSSNLEEILWSDPIEGNGYFYSMRGAGRLFGEDITEKALTSIGVKTLIRSHEPCEGVQMRQKGRVLTLFSRKGSPYFNRYAAYLVLDEHALRDPKDAQELARDAIIF